MDKTQPAMYNNSQERQGSGCKTCGSRLQACRGSSPTHRGGAGRTKRKEVSGLIELTNVCKTFRAAGKIVAAVSGVSLTIADGDIYGIIGFSGAGKSTLVRCINLLERPDSGVVRIDGRDLMQMSAGELRAARRKIGMIFQHFNLMPSRTVVENVAFALRGSGLSRAQMREKAQKLLRLVEIDDKAISVR